MNMRREYLKGIPVDTGVKEELLEMIGGWLKESNQSRQIITMNAAIFMSSLKNPQLNQVVRNAGLVTVDGIGIVLALGRMGRTGIQRLTGVELLRDLLFWCSQNQRTVYFYGGSPRTAIWLERSLSWKWPGLLVSGIQNGYQEQDSEAIVKDLIEKQPDLLLAGLGSPKQEIFLAEVLPLLKKTVGIGIGGALEVLAGLKREAPRFVSNHGWEWLYRMLQDPRRINRLPALVRFFFLVLRGRLN